MNTYHTIITRKSIPLLSEPAPKNEDLEKILKAALKAPDHGRLKPWRFLITEGEGLKSLGQAFADSVADLKPELSKEQLERFRSLPQRAPMVIVVIAETTQNHKIPVMEQILACGTAVQNMLLMAHELGYGAIWRTGELASNASLKKRLAYQEKDEIVAFLYLGTPVNPVKNHSLEEIDKTLETASFARHWP